MAKSKITENDCMKCGLCCASPYDWPDYVSLEEEDLKRLTPAFIRRWTLKGEGGRAIKTVYRRQPKGSPMAGMRVLVCAAFRGAVGGPCRCAIYERRPSVCREWKPGNPTCRKIRRRFVVSKMGGRFSGSLVLFRAWRIVACRSRARS